MMDSVNYYGSLCTEMYELLHSQAPQDELAFYLSYAHPGDRVPGAALRQRALLVPFVQKGFDITGVDLSQEMLEKLLPKISLQPRYTRCSADAFESESGLITSSSPPAPFPCSPTRRLSACAAKGA